MNNLFLTGKIGVGKTTLIKKVLQNINASIGGYMTDRNENESYKEYTIKALYNEIENYKIARIIKKNIDITVSKESFDIGAVSILEKSLEKSDVIIMDELGFMESQCHKFQKQVHNILDNPIPVIGVLKEYDCDFLNSIKNRKDVKIVTVTENNRDLIFNELLNILKDFGVSFKEKKSFFWDKKRINWYNQALDYPASQYPEVFLKEIEKYVEIINGKHILDVGAGTGAFSIPLAKLGGNVTALDSSKNMLESLEDRAKMNDTANIKYILSSFEEAELDYYDFIVNAFSGGGTRTRESIIRLYNSVSQFVFIILPAHGVNDNFKSQILFKMLNKPVSKHSNNSNNALDILKELGYPYDYYEVEYDFPQYFTDFNEAIEFLNNHFNLDEKKDLQILTEFLKEYLIKCDNGYIFPNVKKSGFLVLKKCI